MQLWPPSSPLSTGIQPHTLRYVPSQFVYNRNCVGLFRIRTLICVESVSGSTNGGCNSEVNGNEHGHLRTHLREGTKVFTKGFVLCTEFS